MRIFVQTTYAEEFQVIYVDSPSARRSLLLPYSLCVGCIQWLLSKSIVRKKRGKSNFTMEKPDQHYLRLISWSRSTSIVTSHVDTTFYSKYTMMKMALHFCDLLTKTHNPNLILRKISDKIQLRDIPQNTWLALLKTVKVVKNKECLRNSHSLGL